MKFLSIVAVVVLFSAVIVHARLQYTAERLQKTINCIDGVFAKRADEHSELEKFYTDYKVYAKDSNSRLEGCKKIENLDARDDCVLNAAKIFAVTQFETLLNKLEVESKELHTMLMDSFLENCD